MANPGSVPTEFRPIKNDDRLGVNDQVLRDSIKTVVSRTGFALNHFDLSTNTVLDPRYSDFNVDSTGGGFVITLPTANYWGTGKSGFIRIKHNAGTASVTVSTTGSDTFSNSATVLVISPGEVWEFSSDGITRWSDALVAPLSSGANLIINGAMEIDQRFAGALQGFFGAGAGGYILDRWFSLGTTTNGAIQRVTSTLAGFPFAVKQNRSPTDTGTSPITLLYAMESQDSKPLQGKQVCLSFYALAGANLSGTGIVASIKYGTGTDQSSLTLGAGTWTGQTTLTTSGSLVLTTTWTRYFFTGTIPTTATQIGLSFVNTPSGTAGADDSFYITGVKFEVGTKPTPFSARLVGQELDLCYRYYWKTFPLATAPVSNAGNTGAISYVVVVGGAVFNGVQTSFPTRMRKVPTFAYYNPGAAASSTWRNINTAANSGNAATNVSGEWGFTVITNPQVAGDLASHTLVIHATADAEL